MTSGWRVGCLGASTGGTGRNILANVLLHGGPKETSLEEINSSMHPSMAGNLEHMSSGEYIRPKRGEYKRVPGGHGA